MIRFSKCFARGVVLKVACDLYINNAMAIISEKETYCCVDWEASLDVRVEALLSAAAVHCPVDPAALVTSPHMHRPLKK